MDDERFDRLARVAAGASRRQVLRAVGLGLAGGLIGRTRVPGVAAQEAGAPGPTTCVTDADCVDADGDACTGGRCDNGTCVFFIVDCIPGYVCCGNGECCPDAGSVQCQSDADCVDADNDPCTGATCENGTCVPHIVSCAPGFVCCGGGCVEACAEGQSLDASCRCAGTTSGNGDSGDGDGGSPTGGTTGGPVQLPNTGSGPSSAPASMGSRLAPVALITAGMAAIASRLRRADELR